MHQAKVLIDFIQSNHMNKKEVRLVIIFFTGEANIMEKYDEDLDKVVGDIW